MWITRGVNGGATGVGPLRPDFHIIPDGDRWNFTEENGSVVSTHDTRADAEQAAESKARSDGGGGEVYTHRDEGEFSRIRKGEQA